MRGVPVMRYKKCRRERDEDTELRQFLRQLENAFAGGNLLEPSRALRTKIDHHSLDVGAVLHRQLAIESQRLNVFGKLPPPELLCFLILRRTAQLSFMIDIVRELAQLCFSPSSPVKERS